MKWKIGEKEISIGAFRGLITSKEKLRMQMRIGEGSMFGPNVSYKGDFELPGGAVEEKDLKKVLTRLGLAEESARETEEKLGISVSGLGEPSFYRAVYVYPNGNEDWAFMISTPPKSWDEKVEMKRKTIDVDPDQLDVLGELNKVVSGKKRMWRMSQGALFASNFVSMQKRQRAAELLNKVKPNWYETEHFDNVEEALARFRKELELE
ncbi:hypothetical protein AMJ49_07105 [Parcubacteria bacterium DG_74_2]|nr:MAG: hypothetical protein AMJ49_07105 [Parcubacteria bacterium DG_74_2]